VSAAGLLEEALVHPDERSRDFLRIGERALACGDVTEDLFGDTCGEACAELRVAPRDLVVMGRFVGKRVQEPPVCAEGLDQR
jgi:hypothetical protein